MSRDPARITSRRDVLLLLLYAPGKTNVVNEPISGRTRLVKMLFLFKQEVLPEFRAGTDISEENFYQFFPWDFGPFSSQVYDDISFFQLRGFIETTASAEESVPEAVAEWEKWRESTEIGNDVDVYEEETFRLTELGVAFSQRMFDRLTEAQRKLLVTFKKRLGSAPLRALLRYVYQTYPDDAAKSKIASEVLR
jgi:uncharacterized protein YwgA